jgi:hypothetical protein
MFKEYTLKIIFIVLGILVLIGIGMYVYILYSGDDKAQFKYVGDSTPVEVSLAKVDEDCFHVDWSTKEKTIGYIKYGAQEDQINMIQKTREGMIFTDEHEVEVCDLEKGKKYYLVIVSDNISYGEKGKPLSIEL